MKVVQVVGPEAEGKSYIGRIAIVEGSTTRPLSPHLELTIVHSHCSDTKYTLFNSPIVPMCLVKRDPRIRNPTLVCDLSCHVAVRILEPILAEK